VYNEHEQLRDVCCHLTNMTEEPRRLLPNYFAIAPCYKLCLRYGYERYSLSFLTIDKHFYPNES